MVEYSEAEICDGEMVIVSTRTINPNRCPHFIFVGEHYRDDGSCRCDDSAHRLMMIKEWGYKRRDFKNIPLREV